MPALLTDLPDDIRQEIISNRTLPYLGKRLVSGLTYGISDILSRDEELPPDALLGTGGKLAELLGFILGPGKVLGLATRGIPEGASVLSKAAQMGWRLPLAAAPMEAAKAITAGEPVIPTLARELPVWGVFGAATPIVGAGMRRLLSPLAKQLAAATQLPAPKVVRGTFEERAILDPYGRPISTGIPGAEPRPGIKLYYPGIREEIAPTPSLQNIIRSAVIPQEKREIINSLAGATLAKMEKAKLVQQARDVGKQLPSYVDDISPTRIYQTAYTPESGGGKVAYETVSGSTLLRRLTTEKGKFLYVSPLNSQNGSILFNSSSFKRFTPTTHQDKLEIETPMKVRFKPIRLPAWDAQFFSQFRPVWKAVNMKGRDFHRILSEDAKQFGELIPLLAKMNSASKQKVANALFTEDTMRKLLTVDELTKFGLKLSTEESKTWQLIRQLIEKTKTYKGDAVRWENGYFKMAENEKYAFDASVNKHLNSIIGRVPHPRYGNYVVIATDSEGNLLAHTLAEKEELRSIWEAFKKIPGIAGNPRIYLHSELPHNYYPHLTYDSLMSLMEKAEVDPSSPVAQAMREAVLKAQHRWEFIHRRNIPGYKMDFDTLIKAIGEEHFSAVNRLVSAMARSKATDAANLITDINLKDYAHDFVQTALSPIRSHYSFIRKGLYTWYLGLKPAYVPMNISQTWLNTFPEIAKYEGVIKALPMWGDAWKNATEYAVAHFTGKAGKGINKEWMSMYEKALDEGLIRGQLSEMMWEQRLASSKLLSFASMRTQLGRAIMSFQWATEYSNRSHSFFAGLHVGTNKGLTGKALYDFAVDFIQRTQYVYGPENLPSLVVKSGNMNEVLRMAYMYKSFMHNTLIRLADVFFGKNTNLSYKAAQLISLSTIGGVLGFPAAGLTKKILQSRGIDIEERVRNYVNNITLPQALSDWIDAGMEAMGVHPTQLEERRKDVMQNIASVILKGIPALAGVESPGWIGLADAPFDDVDDVYGMLGSLSKNTQLAIDAIGKRRGWRAAEYMLPALFSNAVKGRRWVNEGVRTPDGEFLFEPTQFEIMLRTAGIPTTREARARELRYVERKMVEMESKKSANYAEWMARAYMEGNYPKFNRLRLEAREKGVSVTRDALRHRILEYKYGRQMSAVPRRMRKRVEELRGGQLSKRGMDNERSIHQ